MDNSTPAPVDVAAVLQAGQLTVEQVEALGGYSVIYADPAWQYRDRKPRGGAEKHYPTMSADELKALPVGRIAAKDSVLFIWGTYPLLPVMLETVEAWGFTYLTLAFQWVKTRGTHPDGSEKPMLGLGHWTRGNTEGCFLATRGTPPRRIDAGIRQLLITDGEELVVAPHTGHSAKPPEVRERIVRLMGDLPRIELFARERAPGWDAWGNETQSDVALTAATHAEKRTT